MAATEPAAESPPARVLKGHTSRVYSVAFSSDGQRLASASGDGTVRVWNVASGECLRVLSGQGDGVHCVVFSPDGQQLASSGYDKRV